MCDTILIIRSLSPSPSPPPPLSLLPPPSLLPPSLSTQWAADLLLVCEVEEPSPLDRELFSLFC